MLHVEELCSAMELLSAEGEGGRGGLLPCLLEGYLHAECPQHVVVAYLAGTAATSIATTEGGSGGWGATRRALLPLTPLNKDESNYKGDSLAPGTIAPRVSPSLDLCQHTRTFNALATAASTLIDAERRRVLSALATSSGGIGGGGGQVGGRRRFIHAASMIRGNRVITATWTRRTMRGQQTRGGGEEELKITQAKFNDYNKRSPRSYQQDRGWDSVEQ